MAVYGVCIIQVVNRADNSLVRMTLNGKGSQTVFRLEPEDAQQLVNAMLDDSFIRLRQRSKVEGNTMRLRD